MAEKDLTKKKKAPLIRISKRANANKWQSVGIYVGAIVFALLIGALLIASVGVNPVSFYTKMLTVGTLGNRFAYKNIENLIIVFVPLLLTSLGLSLSFKMRFWNIGGEGQFIVGAITSAAIAIAMDGALSPVLMIILMALGGGLAAGIYGLFTAVLKVKFGTNETLMTLMLNYIALYLLKYFQTRHGTDFFLNPNSERPIFNLIPENSWMINIGIGKFSLNISLIIALLFTVFIYIYLNKTKHGYEICVVGDSKRTAQYAGMNVGKVILRTMFFSAFIIGMASAFHVSSSHTLSETITNDVGWTGIVVAWLARLNPIGVLIASLLISVLQFGCTQACATYTAIDSNIADLLQGIILFVVLASDFFIRYKVNIDLSYFKRKNTPALAAATAGEEADPSSTDGTKAVVVNEISDGATAERVESEVGPAVATEEISETVYSDDTASEPTVETRGQESSLDVNNAENAEDNADKDLPPVSEIIEAPVPEASEIRSEIMDETAENAAPETQTAPAIKKRATTAKKPASKKADDKTKASSAKKTTAKKSDKSSSTSEKTKKTAAKTTTKTTVKSATTKKSTKTQRRANK